MSSQEDFFSKIIKTGMVKESELRELIERKKERLGYLINDDVAVRLVARDLGVSVSTEPQLNMEVKILDLVPKMRNVSLRVTVEKTLKIKEFSRKDGNTGKVGRAIIKDETGTATLVLWDDNAEFLHDLKPGTQILIRSGYTKIGLNGFLEIHLGDKGEIEILEESKNRSISYKGRVWKVFDSIEFERKNGNKGTMVSFLLKWDGKTLRVLVWNPTYMFLEKLVEGIYAEIMEGELKRNIHGELELHVNDENNIIIDPKDIVLPTERNKLSDIKPGMENLTVEGTIVGELFFGETYNGNKIAKLILKDENTALPLIFWNEKAVLIRQLAKPGSKLRINGCYSKIGLNGLEIVASRWSKLKVM